MLNRGRALFLPVFICMIAWFFSTFLAAQSVVEQSVVEQGSNSRDFPVQVSAQQARAALKFALSVVDRPYILGADGPEAFDCSGLIMWAYWSSLGQETIFTIEEKKLADLTILELYQYGVQLVPREKARPGDIVFIGPRAGEITHGGLIVSTDSRGIRFINASSFYGRVAIDYWTYKVPVREQYIVGYGRIIYN